GSFTVVTGRIGSGKTTLLRTLLGLLPKQSGKVYWNGELIANPTDFFKPPHTAYTPQIPRLFSATVRDNILLGIPQDRADLPGAIHADLPGGHTPARSSTACRPHHRPQRWQNRCTGHAYRTAGYERRDAPPMARRTR